MTQPTNTTPQADIHPTLHNFHVNVKMFGAVGDGVTDDTTALQTAINSASTTGADLYFPPGNYHITSTLTFNADTPPAFRGGNPTFTLATPSVKISSSTINGPLLQRTSTNTALFIIEGIGFLNYHATGTGIDVSGVFGASQIRNCAFECFKGIIAVNNIFNLTIQNCHLRKGGATYAGSFGISVPGHANIIAVDINGYENGIRVIGPQANIWGGRVEVCGVGIFLGKDSSGGTGWWERSVCHGISMEADDTGIYVQGGKGTTISGIGIQGTAASPSGGSLIGIDIANTQGCVISGVIEAGTHATAFLRRQSGTNLDLVIEGVNSATAWVMNTYDDLVILNCSPEKDVIREDKATPTYSASITPNAVAGNWQTITVTNATAFTINAPSNPPTSTHAQGLTMEIFNNSGGAMGAVTWNAAFVLVGGAFTNPANTKKRFIAFTWNGASWIETSRAGADY